MGDAALEAARTNGISTAETYRDYTLPYIGEDQKKALIEHTALERANEEMDARAGPAFLDKGLPLPSELLDKSPADRSILLDMAYGVGSDAGADIHQQLEELETQRDERQAALSHEIAADLFPAPEKEQEHATEKAPEQEPTIPPPTPRPDRQVAQETVQAPAEESVTVKFNIDQGHYLSHVAAKLGVPRGERQEFYDKVAEATGKSADQMAAGTYEVALDPEELGISAGQVTAYNERTSDKGIG